MEYDSATAEYLENLGKVSGLYVLAMRAQLGTLNAYYDRLSALFDIERGGLLMTDAAAAGALVYGGLPVIAMVGVFLALGAPYLEAMNAVKNENTRIGFAEGFVMGILGWRGSQVQYLFQMHGVLRIYQSDENLNAARVKSYNTALAAGYTAGLALPLDARKAYLHKLRQLAGHPSSGNWTRNDQISFVISLATAGLTHGVFKQ